MKTTLQVSVLGRNGGYAEALSVDPAVNTRVPGREIWLADACTPIPNCRPAEIFLSLWSALQTPSSTVIHTDVISAGVHLGSPGEVTPEMVYEWLDMFDLYLSNCRTKELASFVPAGLVVPNSEVRRDRLEKIRALAEALRPHIGDPGYERVRVSDGSFCFKVKISETGKLLRDGGSIGEYVCPSCSHMFKRATAHSLRFVSGELCVTDTRSVQPVRCHASKALLANMRRKNHSVEELVRVIGLRASGKLFYAVSRSEETSGRGLCMRDYSDPRGTVASTVKLWNPNIWITTRLYVRDERDRDLSFAHFMEAVRHNPELFASTMRDNSFLSEGKEVRLVTHTGGA